MVEKTVQHLALGLQCIRLGAEDGRLVTREEAGLFGQIEGQALVDLDPVFEIERGEVDGERLLDSMLSMI